jgi:hypothetical protein
LSGNSALAAIHLIFSSQKKALKLSPLPPAASICYSPADRKTAAPHTKKKESLIIFETKKHT